MAYFNLIFICIGVWLIYNIVLVSGTWQRGSAMHIHISIISDSLGTNQEIGIDVCTALCME